MEIIVKLVLYSALMYGIPYVVPGVTVDMFWPTAVIAGLVFYIASHLIKPILKILTLPITVITLGLFMIVINAAVFWGTAYFVTGFEVASLGPAVIGGIIASVGTWIISLVFSDSE
jgi:putative membrane protein